VLTKAARPQREGELLSVYGTCAGDINPWLLGCFNGAAGHNGSGPMARRQTGKKVLAFVADPTPNRGSLDRLSELINWSSLDQHLVNICAAAKGEPTGKLALLLAIWHGLSDAKLGEALEDHASFRRVCEFAARDPTPERTAFVRFRRELVRTILLRSCSMR
jgi:hypothetical protein